MKVKWPVVELGTPVFVRAAGSLLMCGEDPESYHRGGVSSEDAAALCAGCGFVAECAAYALADPRLSGVWGGTTEEGRRRQRSREAERRRVARAAV